MSKLPSTENTQVFTMRISPKLKTKLNQLAKSSKYGGSVSPVIRVLILSVSRSKIDRDLTILNLVNEQ